MCRSLRSESQGKLKLDQSHLRKLPQTPARKFSEVKVGLSNPNDKTV